MVLLIGYTWLPKKRNEGAGTISFNLGENGLHLFIASESPIATQVLMCLAIVSLPQTHFTSMITSGMIDSRGHLYLNRFVLDKST